MTFLSSVAKVSPPFFPPLLPPPSTSTPLFSPFVFLISLDLYPSSFFVADKQNKPLSCTKLLPDFLALRFYQVLPKDLSLLVLTFLNPMELARYTLLCITPLPSYSPPFFFLFFSLLLFPSPSLRLPLFSFLILQVWTSLPSYPRSSRRR